MNRPVATDTSEPLNRLWLIKHSSGGARAAGGFTQRVSDASSLLLWPRTDTCLILSFLCEPRISLSIGQALDLNAAGVFLSFVILGKIKE